MERERGGRPRYPGVLTPAEQRVLEALRDGGSNAEIAARLGISRETVKTHIASMLSKLDLSDRYELASWQSRAAAARSARLARPAREASHRARSGDRGRRVIVIFAVVIGASRDNTESIDIPLAETAFEVMSCSSGIAVTNPKTNTELVADCEALLGLRDTLQGTGKLNWTAGKPMSEWMGVTVSGTPQRVTSLNLADLGLDGELSGLLGNLTGLTTLDLSGNSLTGMLPSKLALLTSLTTVAISGTSFTGCAPASMNAVGATGLADCGDPVVLEPRDTVMQSGTYRFLGPGADAMGEKPLVFDVPPGLSLHWVGLTLSARTDGCGRPCSHTMVVLEDTVTGGRVGIDLLYGDEGVGGTATDWIEDDAARQRVDTLFDMLRESVWFVEE